MRLFDNGDGATVKLGKVRRENADIPWKSCASIQQILTKFRQMLIQITGIIRLKS
jgi:hypothetical protein